MLPELGQDITRKHKLVSNQYRLGRRAAGWRVGPAGHLDRDHTPQSQPTPDVGRERAVRTRKQPNGFGL